jgi:hypothetical protein
VPARRANPGPSGRQVVGPQPTGPFGWHGDQVGWQPTPCFGWHGVEVGEQPTFSFGGHGGHDGWQPTLPPETLSSSSFVSFSMFFSFSPLQGPFLLHVIVIILPDIFL